jgi:hypothetical protein
MGKYPVHERLKELETEGRIVQNFLDYLQERLIRLCRWDDKERAFAGLYGKEDEIIAGFLGIDLEAFYREKDSMMAQLASSAQAGDTE